MSLHAPSRPLAFLTAALLLGGCTKDSSTPESEATANTLQKLRAEADRVKKGGAASARPEPETDKESRLAGLAAGMGDSGPSKLRLPARNDTVHVDTVAMKLTGLESSHSVRGRSGLGLTTEDLFLRVELVTQNVGTVPAPLSLDGAWLADAKGQTYALARDAQAVAGTRPLPTTWAPEQRTDVVLMFELPPEAVQDEGLALVVKGAGGDVRIPLR
ncbi:hypothetical protein D7Y13_35065 [Corallococcus praedator]|uniref:DUF4352 domain-containing protein n=1 Tax=Corallococcus praedator TaxID=2316724 RepID=A0ABX9QAF5_9BACT|nr:MULTISPECIES: hypothetical protein [Corallococcus]RKH23012.1 hypothetical protein D7X75_34485 [Corallococcus sp. CA031C]RKH92951.1 hypothetical protein D7Y13_35065 [Corallococcus praedator]